MQRRISVLAIATAAVSIAALAGCSNNASGGDAENTLTMFASTDSQDAYQPVIDAFEAANAGVTVNVTWGTGNEFETTETTQLASGNGPDLLDVLPGTGGNLISVGSLAGQGYLEDLSGESWAAEIPDSLRPQTDVDGSTYSYPVTLQPLGAFYNVQAVEAAGLTVPTTWSELLTYCAGASAAGKVAFSLGLQDQWVTQLVPYALAATLVYRDDPEWNQQLVAGEVTFPDSNWTQVEQQYLELNDAGCFSADPNGISFDNTLPPVAAGDALGIVQVGGIFGNLQGQNEDAAYELHALPATDDAAETYIAASPGHGVAVNAASENKELAIAFVAFMAQPEQINQIATTLGGAVPAVPNDTFEASELLTDFNSLVSEGRVASFPDTGWPNAEIQNAHLVGIQNMFLGSATPQQVLEDMQSAVE